MAKTKWPKTILIVRMDDGTFLAYEDSKDVDEEFDGDPVAHYDLVSTGEFKVTKTAITKPIKKR